MANYSHEQHDLVCRLEAALKTAIRAMKRGDRPSLVAAIASSEDALELDHVYHVSYPQWLVQVWQPRARRR